MIFIIDFLQVSHHGVNWIAVRLVLGAIVLGTLSALRMQVSQLTFNPLTQAVSKLRSSHMMNSSTVGFGLCCSLFPDE